MNPIDTNESVKPDPHGSETSPGQTAQDKGMQDKPNAHPDQTGAEFGGYGHVDNSFGRDPGSSSEEGGQGDSEPGKDIASVPKTLRGGSDGSAQTRHAPTPGTGPDGPAGVKQPG